MILSAEEFIALRNSENPVEYYRAATEAADINVWQDVITNYPEMKKWVVHNKAVSIEILEQLVTDEDVAVRKAIASKRKINEKIFFVLAKDNDETVKYTLICNTKINAEQLLQINVAGNEWLQQKLKERLEK